MPFLFIFANDGPHIRRHTNPMKRIILSILSLAAMCACNRSTKFDIEGRLTDNAASIVYLIAENTTVDTLATAAVAADNTFRLRGEAAEPATAFVCDDNGNALAMLLIENRRLHLTPTGNGYMAEGGPINDKYNIIVRRLSDVTRQIAELDPHDENLEEHYETLMMKYRDILSTAISDNLDNIIGVELFLNQEAQGMAAEDMRVRLAQFSPRMRELSAMRRFADYIDICARTETGQPMIDIDMTTISGDSVSLADLCGRHRWVLLDFWATWCEPCLQEIPVLQQAYTRYALQGLEICSISLDRDPERWRSFVARNQMLWTNAIDSPQEGETSAADIYGLQTIPANFLISPDGIIVARNLYGQELMHELETRFGSR